MKNFSTATENQEPEWLTDDEMEEDISVRVSPNPAKDFVNLYIQQEKDNGSFVLEILDINGRVLETYFKITGNQTITWSTRVLPSGIYFYRLISDDGKMESGKIILSK